jgi:pimeloyl-ACP methyl ester carboxylesterase
VIDTLPDGFGIVKPDNFKAGFAADASDADVAFMRDSQVPINMSVFGTKLTNAAWKSKPSWAVIATDDKAFDQRMLQAMARRIGASVTEVKASHAVFMTQPKAVADVIEQAARNAVRTARKS